MAAEVSEATLATLADEQLAAELRLGLDAVEELLTSVDAAPVIDPAVPPWLSPGLRLHALLALLGARRMCPSTTPSAIGAAAVAELTHLATCYHAAGAVLAGDLLIVRATGLVAELPAATLRVWADALRVVHELALVGRPDDAADALRGYALALGASVVGRPQLQAGVDPLVAALTSGASTAPAPR